MLVRYKKNKKPACYDSDVLVTTGPIPAAERPKGPFKKAAETAPTPLMVLSATVPREIALEPICRK